MIMDIEEIAKLFNVHVRTIRRWIEDRGMPTIKIGGTLRFDKDDVLKWAKSSGGDK